MIEHVPDTILEPTLDDLIVFTARAVGVPVGNVTVDETHEHPIADHRSIGVVAFALLGDGYVWASLLTGNGGVVETRREALEALLSESLTEYPRTDRRPV